jgi:hypothetical protein
MPLLPSDDWTGFGLLCVVIVIPLALLEVWLHPLWEGK